MRANYRITNKQDKWVKKQAKKFNCSEAEFIRSLIDGDIMRNFPSMYNKNVK